MDQSPQLLRELSSLLPRVSAPLHALLTALQLLTSPLSAGDTLSSKVCGSVAIQNTADWLSGLLTQAVCNNACQIQLLTIVHLMRNFFDKAALCSFLSTPFFWEGRIFITQTRATITNLKST